MRYIQYLDKIKKNNTGYIRLLINEAKKSIMKHRYAAMLLDNRNNILSIGHNYEIWNKKKTYMDYISGCSVHAEIDCIRRCKKKYHAGRIWMLLLRLDGNGKIVICTPCSNCRRIINNNKIRTLCVEP